MAISREEVIKTLVSTPAVKFSYEKSDGSIRNATGTLSPLVSGVVKDAANEKASTEYVNYYDLDKKYYRKFNITKLKTFNGQAV